MNLINHLKSARLVILTLILGVTSTSHAWDSIYTTQIGGTTWYSGALSGSSYNIGNTTYYDVTTGSGVSLSGSSYRIGSNDYFDGTASYNSYNSSLNANYSGSSYNIGSSSWRIVSRPKKNREKRSAALGSSFYSILLSMCFLTRE